MTKTLTPDPISHWGEGCRSDSGRGGECVGVGERVVGLDPSGLENSVGVGEFRVHDVPATVDGLKVAAGTLPGDDA